MFFAKLISHESHCPGSCAHTFTHFQEQPTGKKARTDRNRTFACLIKHQGTACARVPKRKGKGCSLDAANVAAHLPTLPARAECVRLITWVPATTNKTVLLRKEVRLDRLPWSDRHCKRCTGMSGCLPWLRITPQQRAASLGQF